MRRNLVQSKKFREALEDAMLRYTNKAISTAEMIARLIDLARHLRDAQKHGEALATTRWRRTHRPAKRCRATRWG